MANISTARSGRIAPSISCETCPYNQGDDRECHFDLKRRGGFRGERPHYIGYRLICDKVENHAGKEDTIPCYNFIASGLQRRMEWGAMLRQQGGDADIIRIIAQEGETIERRIQVSVNSAGQIVRPQAEIIEDLKAAGYEIASDLSPVVGPLKEVTYRMKVQNWENENKKVTTYAHKLMLDEMNEQLSEEDAEDALWEKLQAEKREADAKDESAPKRGPGRPRKEEEATT